MQKPSTVAKEQVPKIIKEYKNYGGHKTHEHVCNNRRKITIYPKDPKEAYFNSQYPYGIVYYEKIQK